MSKSPKISVVIPFYNNPNETVRAVLSVLRQSNSVVEIIIVDDASDEACSVCLRRRLEKCSSHVLIKLEALEVNVGPGLARHFGANLASGTHVAFLDADDVWHRKKVEEISTAIIVSGADLIGHMRPWSFQVTKKLLTNLPNKILIENLSKISFMKRNPFPTSSIVAESSIAKKMFQYGERKSEDYMALVVAASMSRNIRFIDAPLCWSFKPPFGVSGEGADQMSIYYYSFSHMKRLCHIGVISRFEFSVFCLYFIPRFPIGMLRSVMYSFRGKK